MLFLLLSFWEKVVGVILPDLMQPQKAVNPLLRLNLHLCTSTEESTDRSSTKTGFYFFLFKTQSRWALFFCFFRPNIQENVIQQHSLETTYIKDCSQSAFRGRLKTFPVAVYQFNLSGSISSGYHLCHISKLHCTMTFSAKSSFL